MEQLTETQLFKRLIGVLAVGAVGAGLLATEHWVPIAWITVVGIMVVGVQLHLALRARKARQVERGHVQAMLDLHALLDIRAPLPPMTGWSATPELVREVLSALLDVRPARIVEAGSGVSTLVGAYGLEKLGQGRLLSLDHDAAFAEVTRGNVARHGLDAIAQVHTAPLVEHAIRGETWRWYDLTALPEDLQIDLLVVDGPPQHVQPLARYPALPLLADRLRDGAVVILDDASRPGERAIAERWKAEFPGLEHVHVSGDKGVALFRYHRG